MVLEMAATRTGAMETGARDARLAYVALRGIGINKDWRSAEEALNEQNVRKGLFHI